MGGSLKGIGSAIGGVDGAVANVTRGMNISTVLQGALKAIAEQGDQRAAFNGILLATAANAAKKPNFNLELEINDLWVRLGNLRSAQAAPSAALMRELQKGMTGLASVLSSLDAAALAVVKNMR